MNTENTIDFAQIVQMAAKEKTVEDDVLVAGAIDDTETTGGDDDKRCCRVVVPLECKETKCENAEGGKEDGCEDEVVAAFSKMILKSSCEKDFDKKEVMKCTDLKDVFVYCKYHRLNGQKSGTLVEYFVKEKYASFLLKTKASDSRGDFFMTNRHRNLELKVSCGGEKNDQFNFVQLRANHDCDYLLMAFHLSRDNFKKKGELFMFFIPKEKLASIIFQHGGYAHGTIDKLGAITMSDLASPNNNNTKEYAIRPRFGDACWRKLLPHRITDLHADIGSIKND